MKIFSFTIKQSKNHKKKTVSVKTNSLFFEILYFFYHINNKTQRGPDNFPFLGVKGSGAGVQGIKYSIEAMTNVKSIVFDVK